MSLLLSKKEQGDVSSNIAELKEGIKKANETMDSLLKYQLVTMAPFPIKNEYFKDVFANISQSYEVNKLKLDLEWKKHEKELESVKHGSNAENLGEMCATTDKRQHLQHLGEDVQCCWNGACMFVVCLVPLWMHVDVCSVSAEKKSSCMHG